MNAADLLVAFEADNIAADTIAADTIAATRLCADV